MKINKFCKSIERTQKAVNDILITKNYDYSASDNVHRNFQIVALTCQLLNVDITASSGCIQYMILHKIQRLCNLVNRGLTPKNESVADTFVDLHAYLHLLETNLEK